MQKVHLDRRTYRLFERGVIALERIAGELEKMNDESDGEGE
jgi:hypothetical protein